MVIKIILLFLPFVLMYERGDCIKSEVRVVKLKVFELWESLLETCGSSRVFVKFFSIF
jgi:hypothetical protein